MPLLSGETRTKLQYHLARLSPHHQAYQIAIHQAQTMLETCQSDPEHMQEADACTAFDRARARAKAHLVAMVELLDLPQDEMTLRPGDQS